MLANRRRIGLSIIIIYVILAGPTFLLANAQYVSQVEEVFTQDIPTTDNGHAYLFVEGRDYFVDNPQFLTHDEDIDYNRFRYHKSDWTSTDNSYPGPATRFFNYGSSNIATWGWLDDGAYLPDFLEFVNTTNEVTLQAQEVRHRFPLAIGAETGLTMKSGHTYYGTFNVTTEEFFHLTLAPMQDGVEMFYVILDGQGRILSQDSFSNGNIIVIPFLPSGEGMYNLILFSDAATAGPVGINLNLEAITPQLIEYGEVYEDTMPGSEWVVGEDGSIIQDEKVPYAMTYEFSSNLTHPGRIQYAFNYPEIFSLVDSYNPYVVFTAGLFEPGNPPGRRSYSSSTGGDTYYYLSAANESYYATFIGSDNVDYYVTNDMPVVPNLPVNREFYLENKLAGDEKRAYILNLGRDSVLRINHSDINGGYSWDIWTADSESRFIGRSVTSNGVFEDASIYYLPEGRYLVEGDASGDDASGFYQFNLGPVIDGAGPVAIDACSLLGVRVQTDPLTFYRMNLTLIEQNNVTVQTDLYVFNQYGGTVLTADTQLGNRQDGVSWLAYGLNRSSYELGLDTSSYSMFCNGSGIIAIAPYEVLNNTAGSGGNEYHEYTIDYDLTFEEFGDGIANATNVANLGDSPIWSNFTLGDPGDASELYVVRLSAPRGVWMNFSVYAEDVTSWSAYAYQDMNGCPQRLSWNDLDDLFVGSTASEASFQMGSISEDILIAFKVERDLADEGSLDIQISPFETTAFENPPPVKYYSGAGAAVPIGGDWLLIGAGVAVVAVVVVVAVYYFRKRA
ncbi:hypothetical protein EU537_03080 [Candidatus Thorarchaeota archaeon]|nr:MAG: hypothetical protein EU537_03080 [Candidatus Thorarchaeota archaeon]